MMIDKERSAIFKEFEEKLHDNGIQITHADLDRPWGGFCLIDDRQLEQFASTYFRVAGLHNLGNSSKISGKLLFVAPGKRLSWQYHHRRNEYWIVLRGNVGVVTSTTDEEHEIQFLIKDEHVMLPAETRHRLIGLDTWSIIAEIWQHTDPNHPSNEADIIRIQDDFNRL